MAQTIALDDLPGFTMTVGVVDGYLIATVVNVENVQVCAAEWQIAAPV